MDDFDSELKDVVDSLKSGLKSLKECGFTYISKADCCEAIMNMKNQLDVDHELNFVRQELADCQRCKLCQGRTNIVFGAGKANASVVFVGEGPGAEEDKQGEPFVGRAGQLLTKMINAMGMDRKEVYICNVVKCRPPKNRDPEPDEIESCEPFLKKQLNIIKPKVIVGLGRHACQVLLKDKVSMSGIRGNWHQYHGIKLMPTFHPAYLLRNPSAKKFVWQDLQEVIKEIELNAL